MTREEFDKLYFGKAIHCDTKEKANHFLALADSVGYKWSSGKSLLEKNAWETYGEETCYEVKDDGFMFGSINGYNNLRYEFIEYQPQPKFKVGDKIRVKDTLYETINGKIGVIEKISPLSVMPYAVKVDRDIWLWYLTENELEKIEEKTYQKEVINNIIEEIKKHQNSINVLLNELERKTNEK